MGAVEVAQVTTDYLHARIAVAIRDAECSHGLGAFACADCRADAVLAEFAPELERLRAKVTAHGLAVDAEVARLSKEVERLRAALAEARADLERMVAGASTQIGDVIREREEQRQRAEKAAAELADYRAAAGAEADLADELKAALKFLYARQVHDGPGLRLDGQRCRGRAADALAWYGVGARDAPHRDEYPLDQSDLAACARTLDMAPDHIAERMRPVFDLYVAALDISGDDS